MKKFANFQDLTSCICPTLFSFAIHLNIYVGWNLTVLALKMSWSDTNFTCSHVSYFFHVIILILFCPEQVTIHYTQNNRFMPITLFLYNTFNQNEVLIIF